MSKSSYPGEFDSDVELPRVDNNITEIGGDAINSLRDAMFAVEQTIGINPQGNTATLVARINNSIDDDGNIKASALSRRGLVTLPILNSHIGGSASIAESKLDLDLSTTYLNARILSSATDIDALRVSLNVFTAQTINHFLGSGDRHDGYMIALTDSIRSSDDVETALHIVNNAFTAHEGVTIGAHKGSVISVNDEFENFTATDVQSALTELDVLSSGTSEIHQDNLHQNGIGLNDTGETDDQGNLSHTTMAPSVFQTEISKATQIANVMRPNVARITSKNIDFRALRVGESNVLRVEAGGIGRVALDINLSALIPSAGESALLANEVTLEQIVDAINTKAQGCDDHYPISAYNTNGQITIAHMFPGQEFTIQIKDDVQFSAATALGFGSVTSTVYSWTGTKHAGYVAGVRVTDFKSLLRITHVHNNRPSNTLPLGLGDLAEYGISTDNEGRIAVNITNHSTTDTDNGLHYIVSFTNNSTIVLSTDIQNGTFDLEIVANTVNFENTSSGEIFDIFVEHDSDGYGVVTKSLRTSYQPISGITPKSVSSGFPTAGIEWQVTDNSEIQFHENNAGGVPVEIPSSSFRGDLKVYAPDNKHSAIFEVHGVPSTGREVFNVIASSKTSTRMHIGSVHLAGNFANNNAPELKFVIDKRNQGASLRSTTADRLQPTSLENTLSKIRNNGVIDGFEVISSDSSSFKIRGGRALVSGKIVEVETKTLEVNNLSIAKRLLLLDEDGKFILKHEFDAGFTFEELTEGDSYGDNHGLVPLVEFETDGTEIDGYFSDRRLIVGKLDKKVVNLENSLTSRIDRISESVSGSMWGFTEASASGTTSDGYISNIEPGGNNGFTYIPSELAGDTSTLSARGFTGGLNPFITTRRFEFSDPDTIKTSVFKAVGMTHINVYISAVYTDNSTTSPFGVSGTAYVEVGIAVETGISTIIVSEEYATVKTLLTGTLPSNSVTERYVVSIPISQLHVNDNELFDFVPRIRILNSTNIDGGTGSGVNPVIQFDHIRVITSSYSVAGNILDEDGTSTPLASPVGEIL